MIEASDEEFDNYSEHEEEYDEIEVDEADAEIMSKFMPTAPRAQKTLADLIMQKIEAKNAMDSGKMEMHTQGILSAFTNYYVYKPINSLLFLEDTDISPLGLDPKVVEAYTKYVFYSLG